MERPFCILSRLDICIKVIYISFLYLRRLFPSIKVFGWFFARLGRLMFSEFDNSIIDCFLSNQKVLWKHGGL